VTLIPAGVYARQSLVTPLKHASKNRCIALANIIRRPPGLGPGGQRSDFIEPIALICTGPLYMYAPHAPAIAPSGVFHVVSATK